MAYDPEQPRDRIGRWVSVAMHGNPGREGRVSGKIVDKHGISYTVFHTSRDVTHDGKSYAKHAFKVFQDEGFDIEKARRGHSDGIVNATELHYSGSRVMDTQTEEAYQKRGIASALYDHVEHVIGNKLGDHWAQTEAGKALWAARKRKSALLELRRTLRKHGI